MSGTAGSGAPRRRGPFSRWPRAADGTLAAVLLLLGINLVDGPEGAIVVRAATEVPLLEVAALVSGAVALYWRRRAPVTVLAAVLVGWVAILVGGDGSIGGYAPVALYAVGRYTSEEHRGRALAGLVMTIALLALDAVGGAGSWTDWSVGAVVLSGAWYVGRRIRVRHEQAARIVRQRMDAERRILAEERTRIARELHDVVAHQVSLMTVQAGAAKAVVATDPTAARRAMAAVEDAGREALGELRHLLGVLRPERERNGDLTPQPGLADVPRLVDHVCGAGVDVTLRIEQPPRPLPSRVDLFAFRVVQEALTNVLKHAGTGAKAQVEVTVERDTLVLTVHDDGGMGTLSSGAGGAHYVTRDLDDGVDDDVRGHGLVGMRERVLVLGGHLDVGPCAEGGYRVLARLPIGEEST